MLEPVDILCSLHGIYTKCLPSQNSSQEAISNLVSIFKSFCLFPAAVVAHTSNDFSVYDEK